ncbi:MAG: nucleotidyltransferase family protein [Bacteroidales bacterium]|nr:nucleotidyltransferase family protein [Bacteroidales bacterium]
MDWNGLFDFMKEQALLGVLMFGLNKMPGEVKVPRDIVLKACGTSENIRRRNGQLYKKTAEVLAHLRKNGFEGCILKGQGNSLMYPDPYKRMPGDIDVFVKGTNRKILYEYIKTKGDVTGHHYHHIEYQEEGIQIEFHVIPCSMNNPFYNKRLQRWFGKHITDGCVTVVMPDELGEIAIPTLEFNVIYQLSHLMHHFFDEGIGLRQMMDYYYLLRTTDNRQQTTDNRSMVDTLRHLNLYHFAGAVMWVLHEAMGLEECLFIVPADEWRGKLLLEEIIKGGNFGKYSGLTNHGMGTKYFLKIKRNLRFVRAYPAEALCEPVFRTWHFFWRMWHKY